MPTSNNEIPDLISCLIGRGLRLGLAFATRIIDNHHTTCSLFKTTSKNTA